MQRWSGSMQGGHCIHYAKGAICTMQGATCSMQRGPDALCKGAICTMQRGPHALCKGATCTVQRGHMHCAKGPHALCKGAICTLQKGPYALCKGGQMHYAKVVIFTMQRGHSTRGSHFANIQKSHNKVISYLKVHQERHSSANTILISMESGSH